MPRTVHDILELVRSTADFSYIDFAQINATNELGDNALHCVCVWGDIEAARILIEGGIDVNKAGEDNYTPLHVACAHGHPQLVELLLAHGADTRARTLGDLPFTTARLAGRDDICQILSEHRKKHGDTESSSQENHLSKLAESIVEIERTIEKNCRRET